MRMGLLLFCRGTGLRFGLVLPRFGPGLGYLTVVTDVEARGLREPCQVAVGEGEAGG
jgi:hypothetical protein